MSTSHPPTTPKPTTPKVTDSLSKVTAQLDELAAWLQKSAMEEVEIEHAGTRLRLKKPGAVGVAGAPMAYATPVAAAPAAAPAGPDPAQVFKSPLVGTYYGASSPEAVPFIQVGDSVKVGQTLGIVEAMKTMNQLQSDRDGVVREILLKNGTPVEFGQPLFVIE